MLAAIRKFAKSPYAIVLLAPVLLVFAVVGFNADVLRTRTPDFVIQVGGRTTSGYDFKMAYDAYKSRLEQRFQQVIGPDLAMQQGLDRRVLEGLASEEAVSELLARIGLGASDKMLRDALRKRTEFFDPVTGEFDETRYDGWLRQNGLTRTRYDALVTDEARRIQFESASLSGLRAPRAFSALGGLFALEQRDLAYFLVDPGTIGPVPAPTEAEIQAFYKQNAVALPEFRAFTLVRFSAKDYEAAVTVDPADVQKQFEFQKDSLSSPDLRTVVQIPAKDAAQATAIIARLRKGEDPAAVAKAVGGTPVNYVDKPRSAFFDPAIAAAAFSLPEGAVSDPVKGQFGLVVLKVSKVTTGKVATLEEHREAIEAKVRGDLAGARVSDISKVYEDAIEGGATLTQAAAKAGAPTLVIGPVASDGRGQDGKPVAGLSPQVLSAVFALPQGGESEGILEAGEGEYFAVRVDRVVPAALPPFATVRAQVVRAMLMRREADLMQARAEALAARIRKGETIEAVAASAGLKVVRATGISRAALQQHEALGRELLGGALGARKGEPFTAVASSGSQRAIAVAVVTALRAGDPQQVAQATEQGRMQFTQEVFGDVGAATRSYARVKLKAQTSLERARLAIGVPPEQAGQGLGGDAPAGKGK